VITGMPSGLDPEWIEGICQAIATLVGDERDARVASIEKAMGPLREEIAALKKRDATIERLEARIAELERAGAYRDGAIDCLKSLDATRSKLIRP
jgi:hypothetical protein